MKARRIRTGYTLREFARAKDLDAGNLSRVERSRVLPSVPTAKRLLLVYGFKPRSEPWQYAVDTYCRETTSEDRMEFERP